MKELSKNITTIDDLKKRIPISGEEEDLLKELVEIHPMSTTRYYLSLLDPEDPADPIRKMSIPSISEADLSGDYDTSGEGENTKLTGLQHKYSTTVLLLSTNRCAAYCRHCFRKRMVGTKTRETVELFDETVKYIREHKEINNVLISGGDPLMLPTEVIAEFLEKLYSIEHLDFVRIGTRIPVVFPARIKEDGDLLKIFRKFSSEGKQLYIVTQFNHPREFSKEAVEGIEAIKSSGAIIGNQSVLLRGVNDHPKIMAELQNQMTRVGIIPYYVFQCRPVKRVKSGFQVPLIEGYRIIEEAKKHLNGHSKRFRYIMSHKTGKIEIVGIVGDEILFKYHQAKNPENFGKIFTKK